MITLIGIAHVIKIRKGLQRVIQISQPNVIGIELDKHRYRAILTGERGSATPLVYKLLSNFQQKVALRYDSKVGDEMLAATEVAKDMGIPVAFIDVPTVSPDSRQGGGLLEMLSFKEKVMLIFGAIAGQFLKKKRIEKELQKFRDNPEKYLSVIGKHYPHIKKALIDDRNRYMAAKILRLSKLYPHVLAVVGDGHIDGISKLLGSNPKKIIRLDMLRKMLDEKGNIDERTARAMGYPSLDELRSSNANMTFHFTAD